MTRGLFVTLEGGEGAGKSTLLRALCAGLETDGRDVATTREPGGSPLGERIRILLLAGRLKEAGPDVEAVAFAAARSDHVSKTIRPALEAGRIVVCDRFFDSTRAYQGHLGVSPDLLDALEEEAVGPWRPDVTLLLDCDPSVGLSRAKGRGVAADRFEAEDLHFHECVRAAFLRMAAREPSRFVVLDASMGAEAVARHALDAVRERAETLMGRPRGSRAA